MTHTRAWRNFKRMQDMTAVAALLLYAAAAVHAVGRLPGGAGGFLHWVVAFPVFYLGVSLSVPLSIPPLRRWLAKYVWMSFRAGFGQTVGSVITGAGLLMAAGVFIYMQVHRMTPDGDGRGANVFSAYASGIGVLLAQAFLVRALERVPEVKALIEEP